MLLIGLEVPIAFGADEQLIRELNLWERRAVVVARIGEKHRHTVDIESRRYERYSIKVLTSITGRCDPARTPAVDLHLEIFESYDIPSEGTVVLLAMLQRDKAGLNEWFIEPTTVPFVPNKQAVQVVEGDILALFDQCRSACEAIRRKLVEQRDYRIAEVTKIVASTKEKYETEKVQFEEGLRAALADKDEVAESKVRERMKMFENYYPAVIAAAEKQIAALREAGK